METQNAQNTDPLADVPDDLRAAIMEFWDGLRPTPERAACPVCGQLDLEVRSAKTVRAAWRYVLHCSTVQLLTE